MAAKAQLQAAKRAGRNRQGADHGRHRRRSVRQGRGRNGADQPRIHPPHVADRRHPGNRPAAGRSAGESGERRHHHGLDGRSDQGLLHRQRAGISGLSRAASRRPRSARPTTQQLELELILADGITYPHKGKFYFADRQVDVRTGAIRLAGLFPNPGNSLRPGPVRQGPNVDQNPAGSAAGSATGGDRPAGHASGRRRRWRQQGVDSAREARRNRRRRNGSFAKASSRASA